MKIQITKQSITFRKLNYKELNYLREVLNTQQIFIEQPEKLEGENIIITPALIEKGRGQDV